MSWMIHSTDILAVIDWGAIAATMVLWFGFDQAMKIISSSKEEKLREAGLNLQKKQLAAQETARTKMADRERGLQRREQSKKGIPDEVWSNLMRSVMGSSSIPGSTEDDLSEVRAADLGDQPFTRDSVSGAIEGDGDVEGILAAIASLQDKTADTLEPKGVYGRIMG